VQLSKIFLRTRLAGVAGASSLFLLVCLIVVRKNEGVAIKNTFDRIRIQKGHRRRLSHELSCFV
jgi:hypothetical protein